MEKEGMAVTALVRDALRADERARGVKIFRTKASNVLPAKIFEKAVTRLGSNFDYDEFMRAMWMLRELIPKLAFMGVGVRLPGVGVLSPCVSGKIDPDDPDWRKKVKVGYRFRIDKELQRETAENITLRFEPMQPACPVIYDIRLSGPDVNFSGELWIGGIVSLVGNRLKFNPENPEEGLFFVPKKGEAVRIRDVLIRDRELVFQVPKELKVGTTYAVQVRAKLYRCRTVRLGEAGFTVRIRPALGE